MSVTARMTRRGPLVPTVIVIAAMVAAFTIFAEVWTQKLWFDSVAFPQVFTTQLLAQVLLFFLFAIVMGGVVGLNMWIAFRLRPSVRRTGQSAVLDRYRDLLESRVALAILVPSAFFGIIAGVSALSQAMEYLAWWNRTPFGVSDSYFGIDVGFYVFEYPVARPAVLHPGAAVFFGLLAAAAVHYPYGGIRSQAAPWTGRPARRAHPPVDPAGCSCWPRPPTTCSTATTSCNSGAPVHRHAATPTPTPSAGEEHPDGRHRDSCAPLFFLNGPAATWTLPSVGLASDVLRRSSSG